MNINLIKKECEEKNMTKRTLKTLLIAALLMFITGCGEKEVAEATTTVETKAEAESVELTPVEATIETGADFDALETLEVGRYSISETLPNIQLEVYEVENKDGEVHLSARITDGVKSENLDSPVLIKSGEEIYLYGKVDYRRSLERVLIAPPMIYEKEENVVWTDFPSANIQKCAGPYNNKFATLGETRNPDGTWHYAIYSEGEELAGLNFENRLRFKFDEGVAISESGAVYLLYYTANTMEAYEVELPEKADSAYIDDTYAGFYGVVEVFVDQNDFYIIKTAEHEALVANGLDYIDRVSEPLNQKPKYTVLKGQPENFDRFETWFGGDSQEFGMNCYMEVDAYTYRYDMYLYDEVEKHYLIQIIPEDELEQVWCKEYNSYSEVEEAIENLNQFLDNWEEENWDLILEEIKFDMDYWETFYPEVVLEFLG